jgi:hypothetical protein
MAPVVVLDDALLLDAANAPPAPSIPSSVRAPHAAANAASGTLSKPRQASRRRTRSG